LIISQLPPSPPETYFSIPPATLQRNHQATPLSRILTLLPRLLSHAVIVLVATLFLKDLILSFTRKGPTGRSVWSMAWRSSGSTNEALIGNLANNGMIKSKEVKEAMLGVSLIHCLLRFCGYARDDDREGESAHSTHSAHSAVETGC
jgi:hypothetical protein